MASGLQRGVVSLAPYDAAWPDDFESEATTLRAIFGSAAAAIEHVGSTSVPGLMAKPIIDIEVGLSDFSGWRNFVDTLEATGYTFMPERVSDAEVFMPKGPEEKRTHYLHMTQFGGQEWQNTLYFRDQLRQDEVLRQEYQALKQQLAVRFPDDRAAYSKGKVTFIERVMQS